VQSSVTHTLSANVENLTFTGTSGLSGTGNALDNALTGNSGANRLTGGAGNDTLNGGTGNDTLVGGTGNDTYFVNVATDVVTELANEGTDTVNSSVTLTLGNNVENLILTGTSTLSGTGNALNNVLTGNTANNTLTGAAGNDTLDGGTGNDTMVGGLGDDTYVVNIATDVVTESASQGNDTVQSAVTLTLGSNVENLILTGTSAINGTGNTVANLVRGNTANNTLTGAAGVDVLEGGAGNDTVSDSAGTDNGYLNGGADTDTLTGGSGKEFFLGGTGNDMIWLRMIVIAPPVNNPLDLRVAQFRLDLLVDGGRGNDVLNVRGEYVGLTVVAGIPRYRGEAQVNVLGGSDTDYLNVFWDDLEPVLLTAVADGGAGIDTAITSLNVTVVNCEF